MSDCSPSAWQQSHSLLFSRLLLTINLPCRTRGAGMAEGDRKGPVGPPSSNHNDCILDLKVLNVQSNQNRPLLLSAGRDGVVKVWR